MKNLVLITSHFPFGTGESFIGSEFPFLAHSFDRIIVISQDVKLSKTRETSDNTKIFRYNPATNISGFLRLPGLILSNFSTIKKLYQEEIIFRKETGNRLTSKNLLNLFKKIIKAIQLKEFIQKTLTNEGIKESIVFYSYWLKTGAHAVSTLDYKGSIKIARAHGSDIYEEKIVSGYLPLLKHTALNLDSIFFISENGKRYFEEKVRLESPRFLVSYLGVSDPGSITAPEFSTGNYRIVSCSNMIALKRINLIIYALGKVKTEKNIEWVHFGDGVLRNDLEKLAASTLKPEKRIKFRFMGQAPNNKILDFYRLNRVDLFINTSFTEGIPVTIMEAQSFGIPVIATNTGGVKEIVAEGTGSLLPVDFEPDDLARMIESYSNLTAIETDRLRTNAMSNWNSKFNAESNYNDFIMKVNSILASAK
jgi:glycosyltransferase involved in cell wall biosynthesis